MGRNGARIRRSRWRLRATPFVPMAEALEGLARPLEGGFPWPDLRLVTFNDVCLLVTALFICLGFAFKFAELEYVSKMKLRRWK